MPMFNNGGNGVFDFEAGYQEDFVRYRSQQTGFEMGNSVEFAVKTDTVVSPSLLIEIVYSPQSSPQCPRTIQSLVFQCSNV